MKHKAVEKISVLYSPNSTNRHLIVMEKSINNEIEKNVTMR